MELKNFAINLSKIALTSHPLNSQALANVKLYGDGSKEFSEELINEIEHFLSNCPQELIEKLVLYNMRRSHITTYSKVHFFPEGSYLKRADRGIHFANSDFELYISEHIVYKLKTLINTLKGMARRDIEMVAKERIELGKEKNLLITAYPSSNKERLFLHDNDPLIYTDITKRPDMKRISNILKKYREVNGQIGLDTYNSHMMQLYGMDNDGTIILSDIKENPELKEVGLSLVRHK